MGLRRGQSSQRAAIRSVSLLIIVVTIPLYVIGLGIWLLAPQGNRGSGPTFTPINNATASGDNAFPTFTPLGQDESFPTFTPQGGPILSSATPNLGGTFTYYTPPADGSTATPPPTRYLSPTPAPTLAATNTVPPTNTPVVAPTDVIVATPLPPLLPATDTPAP